MSYTLDPVLEGSTIALIGDELVSRGAGIGGGSAGTEAGIAVVTTNLSSRLVLHDTVALMATTKWTATIVVYVTDPNVGVGVGGSMALANCTFSGPVTPGFAIRFRFNPPRPGILFRTQTTSRTLDAPAVAINKLCAMTVARVDTQMYFWVNGAFIGSVATGQANNPFTQNLCIGNSPSTDASDRQLRGGVQAVVFHDRVLATDEISTLHDALLGGEPIDDASFASFGYAPNEEPSPVPPSGGSMTVQPGGVFGSKTASDMLKEAQAGQAVVIAAILGPSYAVYSGRGMWDAMTRTLDGGVSGFENAGSSFVGYGRSATVGSGSRYAYSLFGAHATDSQSNNPSAETSFSAWQGSNVLADCVNVRDATTLSSQDVAISLNSGLSWYPTTNPGTDLDKNVTVYSVFGTYGGEGANLECWRQGARNLNTTSPPGGGNFQTASVQNDGTGTTSNLGETTGATAINRLVYSTPYIPSPTINRIYGTSEVTTAGIEFRLAHFGSAPTGMTARQIRGKMFHAGSQVLRSGATAGNGISWVIASSGGATYADLADFFDTTAEQTAVQLRADEMKANLVARGDTRPVYVIFFVMEDANTFTAVAENEGDYLAQVNDLLDNLKACGEAFTSVDGWAIMHQGQPPSFTGAEPTRAAAYVLYRQWAAENAADLSSTHNLQYLNPVIYTNPANDWATLGTLWFNEGAGSVHFTDAGHRLMTNEAVLASIGFATVSTGGHRSRARYDRAR
jgi:hypothetical protein